jgi:thioredoxin-like negative regulator of GroEL
LLSCAATLPVVANGVTGVEPDADAFGSWRAALEANPGNASAWRLAAAFLEEAGDPRALEVRRQIVVNEPWEIANRFAFVHTALRFQDLPTAQRAFAGLQTFAEASGAYTDAAAALAFASGYSELADDLLRAELQDKVDRATLRRSRATLRLRFGRPKQMPPVRREFLSLTRHPNAPQEIWRELVADALRHNDTVAAVQLSGAGAARPEASFADDLLSANVLLLYRRQEFPAVVATLAPRAAASPENAALFANWLIARGRIDDANLWLQSSPPAFADVPSVRAARADGFAAAQKWDLAWPLIEAGAWGTIAPDVAASLGSMQQVDDNERGDAVWDDVLHRSMHNPAALRLLHRFTLGDGMEREREELLRTIAQNHPQERWAFQALADEYARQKDTEKLLTLYSQWHDVEPENIQVESRMILLTLLTRPKPSVELRAQIDRRAMHHPRDPTLATARALALWQLGREQEALTVTENIPNIDRRSSLRAFYHGLFTVAAGGRSDEAGLYLSFSEKADLLPEEARLIGIARGLVGRRERAR